MPEMEWVVHLLVSLIHRRTDAARLYSDAAILHPCVAGIPGLIESNARIRDYGSSIAAGAEPAHISADDR